MTPATAPVPGAPAPAFALPGLNGGTVRLADLLARGQPVVVNTWASWCGPCKDEAAAFTQVARQYAGQVQFVGVNMTFEDQAAAARAFVQQYGVPYTVALDPQAQFMQAYHLIGTPTTYFISRSGHIVQIHPGPLTAQQLTRLVQQTLMAS
ncbi:MAG: TlpA family protein disulfide reductase [Thermoflavifilum sp.]|nr:TlpA family protein disulfide reductase [Thermoflavifilum sp.]MCL6514187.1 TlpA family protein disulfide reductase [Alicyclobacillus sp.]